MKQKSIIPKYIFFCVLAILWLQSCKRKTVEDVTLAFYQKGQLNGVVLLAQDNEVIYDTVLGYSNPALRVAFPKPSPSFYIASLAKPLTAAAIMILQQQGLLRYDDKAGTYIKELPQYAQYVTIRHLINHTSGLKDYEEASQTSIKGLKNSDVLCWLRTQKTLNFPPGTKYEYSNSGYVILSLIIENISKQTYSQFLKENIFEPSGMKHTIVYDETRPIIPNKITGFNKMNQVVDYGQLTTGDGGIYTSAQDLLKFDKALRDGSLINGDNIEIMYRTPHFNNGNIGKYGFGWFVDQDVNGRIAMHTGGLDGFRSLFWRDLKNTITLIVLTNRGDTFPVYEYLNAVKKTICK